MKNGILILLIACSFSLFAQDNMNTFTYVEIDGPVKIELIQADEHKVEVLQESELVQWEINGKSLVVMAQYREDHDTPIVRIHVKELQKLHLFGQVALSSTGTFESKKMNIQLSSQSMADLQINTEELEIKLRQQSILKLTGTADQYAVEANQQSILNAKALESSIIEVVANQQSVVNIQQEGAKVSSRISNQSVLH